MSSAKFFTLLLVLLFSVSSFAQIPNGDFENWNNNDPVGWSTNNIITPPTITKSSDAYSGSAAVKCEVVMTSVSTILPPLLISGLLGTHGIPVSERYANLSGYYKLVPVNNENFFAVIGMYKNGQAIGVGGAQFPAASAYTNFSVPIYYTDSESVPDSCEISFTINGIDDSQASIGAVAYLDDISFNNSATSVNESNPGFSFNLDQNYPNPFNPTTKIKYSISKESLVTIKVYDALGEEVKTLVNQEKPAGLYEITFDGSSLASGIYYYHLQTNDFSETKKMILLK